VSKVLSLIDTIIHQSPPEWRLDLMTVAIEVENLTKLYGDLLAVDHISFSVNESEIFGFLGPNGAGKTTTTRMLTGISTPTEGSAKIMGYDIRDQAVQAKEQMGIVTDISNVYLDLTAWDNLVFTAKLYGIPKGVREKRAKELLDTFGLLSVKDEKTRDFSGGMKRRLTIAMALVNEANVLFLDEPTAALDVQSVRTIRELIRNLNASGITIFLTTHNMHEASELCDRVAIINQGIISEIDTPEHLKQAMDRVHSVEIAFDEEQEGITEELRQLQSVREVEKRGTKIRLFTLEPPKTLSEVFEFSRSRNMHLMSINTLIPTLEDVFLELTGEKIVERSKRPQKSRKGKNQERGRGN
jgi:ABC-2 type transport system ATP-binding protein